MDPLIALRLSSAKGNEMFDAAFAKQLGTIARQYIDAGLAALNYVIPDFDCISDKVQMFAPIDNPTTYAKGDRNAAINFIHPELYTEMQTLCTFLAQILFGGEQARSVEAKNEEDDNAAEAINALLAWNDAKIGIYLKGWLWIWAAVVYNRGVMYEKTAQDVNVSWEEIEEADITKEKVHGMNKAGQPRFNQKGEPIMVYPTRTRFRKKRTYSGFFNDVDLVSPYDFICDPTPPVSQLQEKARFMGHRVLIPWNELKRRSELDPDDDQYVLPEVVKKVKIQKGNVVTPGAIGGTQSGSQNCSRTYYDRQLRGANAAGIGGIGSGLIPGSDSVNKEDGGTVECFNLTIRIKPADIGMYKDDVELEMIQLLITNQADVLSVNILPNEHDQFPYAVAEARPDAHRQFSPSIGMAIIPVQNRIDNLNKVHADAQARMGNILIVDDTKCDVANLLTPDKNGLMIMRKAAGQGAAVADLVSQIPLKDVTANYNAEMQMWIDTARDTTGAHAFTQGQTEDPSQTLGQFDSVKQMAVGRISSIARILSEQAITPQTRRFVINAQQFMPSEMMIRVIGKGSEFDPDNPPQKWMLVKKADIQAGVDVVPHDGSLPGADNRVVAASSRAIEAYSTNPALAPAFDVTQPGALDPTRILRELLKKTGLPVERFSVTREQAMQNAQSRLAAQGTPQPGMVSPQQAPEQQMAAPAPAPAGIIPPITQPTL